MEAKEAGPKSLADRRLNMRTFGKNQNLTMDRQKATGFSIFLGTYLNLGRGNFDIPVQGSRTLERTVNRKINSSP